MTVTSTKNPQPSHRQWWKEATIYQIYPSSFKDSDGDGLGDIRGVIEKLDYLQNLGVDAVWLCPIFASPQVDMGYDISDYRAIHPPYGTVEDVQELIQGLHKRGMRCILDLVVNHSSDQHEWFKKSRASRDNEWRDWYVWRKPRYDVSGNRQPPNNWAAAFGGSAWTYDGVTDEYYLHLFAPEQPDLNWENPAVVREVHEVMEFWLKKGVDGFRMDVINFISKEPGLPDAEITDPAAPWQSAIKLFCNGPRLHEHLRGLRQLLDRYGAFSVGEMPGVKEDDQVAMVVASDRKELHTIFQFDMKDWKLPELKGIIEKWQTFAHKVGGWNAIFLENHDQARSVSRYTKHRPEHRELASKMLATCLCTLGGTLFVYQGQELGMANLPQAWGIEEYKDIESLNFLQEALKATGGDEKPLDEIWTEIRLKARDHARSPVQWDTTGNAGFTTGTPWMKVNEDVTRCNARNQQDQPDSVLSYWRRGISLRKKLQDVLVYGTFEAHDGENEAIMSYTRHCETTDAHAVVMINFTDEEQKWQVPVSERAFLSSGIGQTVLSTYDTALPSVYGEGFINLRAFEAIVVATVGVF
ncbi:hypothetical protein Neosp_014213 [[Neocosmospora] mangrovei]